MANNEFAILIKAWLDDSSSGVSDLNEQIKKLANHPGLAKLKLSVDLDTKTLDNLQKQVQNIQNRLERQGIKGLKIIDIEDVKSQGKELFKTLDDVINKYKNLGKIDIKKEFDPATKELSSFVLELEKGNGIIEKMKFNLVNTLDGNVVDEHFILDKITQIDKTATIQEKILQTQHKTNVELEKIRQKEKERTDELEHQLQIFKQQQAIRVQEASRRYKGLIDNNELEDYLKKVNQLSVDTPNVQRQMRSFAMELKQIETNAKTSAMALDTANKSSISFGNAIKTAFEKFSIWLVAGSAIMQSWRFFTNGISYVNELNKSLTEISIVTGKTQKEVEELAKEYAELAFQMGVTTKEITKASVEFYRQGLSEAEVMERMKVATQYARISNLDFTQSAEILTATTNSMGVSIERASDVFSYLGKLLPPIMAT